ncbi:MAG: LytR/AlgR family response regulator transcription factor [Anaerolineae bacterium]
MKILLVDDETPARKELRFILETLATDAEITEAAGGEQALQTLAANPVDVVFLDINMPGQDGLALAATILERERPPLIIFATAYNEHAVKAFELAALDYVVKPFDEDRLAVTVERAREALAEREQAREKETAVRRYLQQNHPTPALPKLWGRRQNENWALVDYGDILWAVAEAKKVYVVTAAGEKLLVRHTLKELASRLAGHNIVPVHKGYLVNLNHVAEIAPWFSGTYVIRMKRGLLWP